MKFDSVDDRVFLTEKGAAAIALCKCGLTKDYDDATAESFVSEFGKLLRVNNKTKE